MLVSFIDIRRYPIGIMLVAHLHIIFISLQKKKSSWQDVQVILRIKVALSWSLKSNETTDEMVYTYLFTSFNFNIYVHG